MTEGEKKKIYYDLRNNNVLKGKMKGYICTTYTFGRYQIEDWFSYIVIGKANLPKSNSFVHIPNACWYDYYLKNDVYAIAVAAKNKVEGKEYIDPYKNTPVNVEIKNLTKYFGKEMLKNADEFLPVDISTKEKLKTIVELKQFLAQKLEKYYTK